MARLPERLGLRAEGGTECFQVRFAQLRRRRAGSESGAEMLQAFTHAQTRRRMPGLHGIAQHLGIPVQDLLQRCLFPFQSGVERCFEGDGFEARSQRFGAPVRGFGAFRRGETGAPAERLLAMRRPALGSGGQTGTA